MFALAHGVTAAEWHTNPAVRFALPPLTPELVQSDDDADDQDMKVDEQDEKKTQALWQGWESGERARDAAKAAGQWPDGARIGRGHGSPYLQPQYARSMRAGIKSKEGRPLQGVAHSDARAYPRLAVQQRVHDNSGA